MEVTLSDFDNIDKDSDEYEDFMYIFGPNFKKEVRFSNGNSLTYYSDPMNMIDSYLYSGERGLWSIGFSYDSIIEGLSDPTYSPFMRDEHPDWDDDPYLKT
jgi:hypothetical protein